MTEFSSPKNSILPSTAIWGRKSALIANDDEENDKENIRPTAAKPTASSKVKPSSCVFVASLRASESDDDLCRSVTAHFSRFGSLISVKVLRDPANRPYAFVQYSNDEDCRSAIELGHNSILSGRRLRCEAAKVNRTLFLAGSTPMTLSAVEQKMSEFGETELIVASSGNGQPIANSLPVVLSSPNWFVKYCYRDDAIRAFASITDDAEFNVEWAKNIDDMTPGVPRIDKLSIYVGQLASDVTEKDLRDHFSTNGEIEELSIKTKANSTFAFISFGLEEAAASAVARENHSMFMNKTIHVQYKEVTSRTINRVILSPRTPIALAPPPINVRRRQVPLEAAYVPQGNTGSWGRNAGVSRNVAPGLLPRNNIPHRKGDYMPMDNPRNYKASEKFVTPRNSSVKSQTNQMSGAKILTYSNRPKRHFGSKIGNVRTPQEGTPRDFIRQNQKDSSQPSANSSGAEKPPFRVQASSNTH